MSVFDGLKLCRTVHAGDPATAAGLKQFLDEVDRSVAGTLLHVPHSLASRSKDVCEAFEAAKDQNGLNTWRSIVALAGDRVRVCRQGGLAYFAGAVRSVPKGLYPLLVCDASASVSGIYDVWQRHDGPVKVLVASKKSYVGLTIHFAETSGSADTFRNTASGRLRAAAIAKVIDEAPDRDFLVIHHKAVPLPEMINKTLASDPDRVGYLTYGQHLATNRFRACSALCLAGTLFPPDATFDAYGLAILGSHEAWAAVRDQEAPRLKKGEAKHNILQAICRGAVRVGEPCDAYIIAAKAHGYWGMMRDLFDGCDVVAWRIIPPEDTIRPESHIGRAVQAVTKLINASSDGFTWYKDVLAEAEIEPKKFRNVVIGDKAKRFEQTLAASGIEMQRKLNNRGDILGFSRRKAGEN